MMVMTMVSDSNMACHSTDLNHSLNACQMMQKSSLILGLLNSNIFCSSLLYCQVDYWLFAIVDLSILYNYSVDQYICFHVDHLSGRLQGGECMCWTN